jgi:hypothetical protein
MSFLETADSGAVSKLSSLYGIQESVTVFTGACYLSHMNPLCVITLCFYEIHFNPFRSYVGPRPTL